MGKVKFFCSCGKELWEDLSKEDKKLLTIEIAEETCICSDCIIKEEHEARDDEKRLMEVNRKISAALAKEK